MSQIKLIVGLGNPGPEYKDTRHNAGVMFLEQIANAHNVSLKPEKKFHGLHGKITLNGKDIHLLFPTTFMNRSGLKSTMTEPRDPAFLEFCLPLHLTQ